MAITKESIVATIEIDLKGSNKNLKDLQGNLKSNSNSFGSLENTIQSLNSSIGNLETVLNKLGKVLSVQNKEVKKFEETSKSLEKTNKSIQSLSQSTEQLSGSVNSSFSGMNSELTGFNKTMQSVRDNIVFVSQIGLTGLVLAGANASGMFKGLGGYLQRTNIGFVNLYEIATISSVALGGMALAIGQTDSEFMQFTKTVLIAGSVVAGAFALKSHLLLTILADIAYSVGTVLVDAMEQWEAKSAKAAEVTRQFIFTLKGFAEVFGSDVIGSLEQWQGVIDGVVSNTTFSVTEVQKAVKILVAEGKALGLSYKTNVDLLKRSADIAAQSGLSIEDITVRIAQGLSGNSQSLIALGINVSEAALAHSKYILASEKTVSQLTDQEKTQLRLNEIMEQTSPIIGAAEYQVNSIIGSQKQLQKAVDNLTIRIGQQSKAVIFYNKVLTDFYTAMAKLPDPIVDTVALFMDFGGVFLKVIGYIGKYITLVLGLVTAHRLLNLVLVEFAAVQSLALVTMNKLHALFKLQAVTVVTASTIYATLAKILSISVVGAFLGLISVLKGLAASIWTTTAAILANPLFYKITAIVIGIYYLVKAIQNVIESMKSLNNTNLISISATEYLVGTLEFLRSGILALGSVIEDTLTASLAGLVSLLYATALGFLKLYKMMAPPSQAKDLENLIDGLDYTLASISSRGSQSLANLRKGVVGNTEAFADGGKAAGAFGSKIDYAAYAASKLAKATESINKAAIALSITGDEADKLNISFKEAQKETLKSQRLFIESEGTKKEYLNDYIKALENQYKAEAQIAKFRKDSMAEIDRMTSDLTIEQLKNSGNTIAAIEKEFQVRQKEFDARVELIKKTGQLEVKQIQDIRKAQELLNKAKQAEIKAVTDKQKSDAIERVKKELKEETEIIQDIQDKNIALNKTITNESLPPRQAILEALDFELEKTNQQIESYRLLYGEQSKIIPLLEEQKKLLENQADIDLRKTLPELPTDSIKKFWDNFTDTALGHWARIKNAFSDIKMPELSFGGAADFGKQLLSTGEAFGSAVAQGASVIFDYAAIVIDIIKQAPDILKSTFLELPGILLDALTQIPAILDQIIAEFPAIIQEFAAKLPALLVNIAQKIPDFIMMVLEQLPVIIEKLAEAIPEIIVIIIKNLPKMVGALIKALVNGVLALLKGLGKGITDLLTGKKINLGKIVDTKGLEDKIKKLSGETGRIFSVENLMEAAQDPVNAVMETIKEGMQKGADLLTKAWNWINDNIIKPIGMIITKAWQWVYNTIILPIYNVVRDAWLWVYNNIVMPIYNGIRAVWLFVYDTIIKPFIDGLRYVWEWVNTNIIAPIANVIMGAWQWVDDNIIKPMSDLGRKIAEPFENAIRSAGNFFKNIGDAFGKLFKLDFNGLKQAVSEAFGSAGEALKSVFRAIMNPFVDIFNGLISAINALKIPEIGWSISAGKLGSWKGTLLPEIDLIPGELNKIPRFAEGGLVGTNGMTLAGFGTDTVPAMLTPGEFVMNRRAVENNGLGLLSAMNSGKEVGGNTYQVAFEINIDAKTTMDEGYIRGTLIPKMQEELKRASLDGKFVLSSRGIR